MFNFKDWLTDGMNEWMRMKGRRPNVHDELKKFKEKCNDHDLILVLIVIKFKMFGTMSSPICNRHSSASFRRFSISVH